jgi:tRNA (uracil-5-)-methyltransferase TRM9
MFSNQEKVWDKIAPQWNEYKTKRNNLSNKFLKGKNKKILDLGCGSGRNFIKTDATIYGLDFSKEMLKYAKEKAEKLKIKYVLVKSNATKIPFENNFFDKSICIALLHCVKSKRKRNKVLQELHRVLKPNSQAFITVWNKSSPRLKNKPKKHKVPWTINGKKVLRDNYLYDFDELKKDLENIGFKILEKFENRNNLMFIIKKI